MIRVTTFRRGAARPSLLRLCGPNGAAIEFDLADMQLSDEQHHALTKLFTHGDITRLNEEEKAALSKAEASLGGVGADAAAFIRFDLKVVRIDKAPQLDWEEIFEATLIEETDIQQEIG